MAYSCGIRVRLCVCTCTIEFSGSCLLKLKQLLHLLLAFQLKHVCCTSTCRVLMLWLNIDSEGFVGNRWLLLYGIDL